MNRSNTFGSQRFHGRRFAIHVRAASRESHTSRFDFVYSSIISKGPLSCLTLAIELGENMPGSMRIAEENGCISGG